MTSNQEITKVIDQTDETTIGQLRAQLEDMRRDVALLKPIVNRLLQDGPTGQWSHSLINLLLMYLKSQCSHSEMTAEGACPTCGAVFTICAECTRVGGTTVRHNGPQCVRGNAGVLNYSAIDEDVEPI